MTATAKESGGDTLLVRLKPHDPRRGHVLRRFTYRGIKFHEERGWYVVDRAVADYLRKVPQRETDPHSPLAFDVATEEEAKGVDAREADEAKLRKAAAEAPRVATGRGDLTTEDVRRAGGARGQTSENPTAAPAAAARPDGDKAKKDRA